MSSKHKILKNPCFEFIPDIASIAASYFKNLEVDFNFFGFAAVQPDGNFNFLATSHEWPEEFFAEKRLPPIGFNIYNQISNKIFFPTMDKGDVLGWADDVTIEAKERFNIANPMLITQKFPDRYELFIFDLHCQNVYETYINHFEIFENFLHHYKYQAKTIIDKISRHPLKVEPHFIPNATSSSLFEEPDEKYSFPTPQRYYLYHGGKERSISAQEYQCLSLLSRGKMLKSIANSLRISDRTVETYIDRMKKKLGVTQREELIDIYWKNKILSG